MATKQKPPRLDETPDFTTLLEGLDREVATSIKEARSFTLVGIRVFDDLARNETATASDVFITRLHRRLPQLIKRVIRQEESDVRPSDVFQPLGDVFFVIFPNTTHDRIYAPVRRILEAWRQALLEATLNEKIVLQRTYHIGVVSWSPAIRPTHGKELLGFGTFMVDEAGRRTQDPMLADLIGVPKGSKEAVHLATFHWL